MIFETKDDVFNFLNYKFDIIFLDPPYKDKHLEKILISIKNSKILSKNGILILLPKDKIKESLELYLLFSKQNHKREINKFDLRQYNQVITNG